MEIWICVLAVAFMIIAALVIKIYLMKKSAREIRKAFWEKIKSDTNTLISISSHDHDMCKLADDINAQLKELYGRRQRYQQGDLELKEAITNISHDLRTPLTAIYGYLELLKREEASETVKNYLDIIENRTVALRQLTEELFRYTVAASEAEKLELEDIIINGVLEESISSYYAVLKQHEIMPDISIPEKKVVRRLNREALVRIFGNIISNAVKYSDGDLRITLSEEGEIVFSNHAAGLTDVEVGKLFDRFYTVNNARKSTGLGLSIAKMLTEEIGGTIAAYYSEDIIRIRIFFPEVIL